MRRILIGLGVSAILSCGRGSVVRAVPPRAPEAPIVHLLSDGWAPREMHVPLGVPVRIVNDSGARQEIDVSGPGDGGPVIAHDILLPGMAREVRPPSAGNFYVHRQGEPSPDYLYNYVTIVVHNRQ